MKYLSHRLSAAMWARVLLLWLVLGLGALVLGGVAYTMGKLVQDNVRTELSSQQITFTAAENLSDEEKALPGLVEFAGQPLTTGAQAQAYAGYIGLHLKESADGAGYPDATYATLGAVQRTLRTALADAKTAGDQAKIDEAQAQLDAVTNLRNTMLTGSTLRGNLFSAYGWDNVASGITLGGLFVIALAVVFFLLFIYEWRRGHLPPTEA